MPGLRGENVGTAYVRIIADGSEVPDGIRDALEDADPVVRSKGEEHGKEYEAAFRKKFGSQKGISESLAKKLEQGAANAHMTDAFFNGREWKRFLSSVKKKYGDLGVLAAKEMQDRFAAAGTLQGFEDEFDRFYSRLSATQKRVNDAMAADEHRTRLDMDREWELHINRLADMYDEAYQMNANFNRKRIDDERDWRREFEATNKSIDRTLSKAFNGVAGANSKILRAYDNLHKYGAETWNSLDRMREQLGRSGTDVKKLDNNWLVFAHHVDRVGHIVGRSLGKGSRNDFFNFIGSAMEGMVRLVGVIPKVIGGAEKMKDAFGGGGGKSLGQMIGAVSSNLAALGITIAVVGAAISLFASLVSGLLAAIVALAGSLTFALAGALGAVLGAVVPLAAGIGTAIVAFKSLDDAQRKALAHDFKPLVNTFKDFGDSAADKMFANAAEQAGRLNGVMERFQPLAARMGTAVSNIGDYFLDVVESPGFRRFQNSLVTFLPHATEALGRAFSDAFGGLSGMFRAMEPLVTRFVDWIAKIAEEFNNWANSREGQRELREFFADAADSAKAVGGFLEQAAIALGELFDQGRGTGDDIFDMMTRNLKRFIDYLRSNPNVISQWFKDGKDIIGGVGDAILGIVDILDGLEDPQTRAGLVKVLEAVAKVATFVGDAADKVLHLKRELKGLTGIDLGPLMTIKGVGGAFSRAIGAVQNFIGWADRMDNRVSNASRRMGQAVRGAVGGMVKNVGGGFATMAGRGISAAARMAAGVARSAQGMGSRARAAVSGMVSRVGGFMATMAGRAISQAGRMANGVASHARSMASRARSAISGLPGFFAGIFSRLPAPAQRAVAAIIRFFAPVAGRIMSQINGIPGQVAGLFNRIPGMVASIPGRIVGMFAGLGGRILSAIGSINIGSLIHVPDPGGGVPFVPGIATGGWFGQVTNGPKLRWIGEDGPEAVVPLDRPLSQVDPAVRWLSAIAQNKVPGMASGGLSGRTVDASGWTIVTPNADPEAVAQEALNRLHAATF